MNSDTICRSARGASPHDIVLELGTLKVLHYRCQQSAEYIEPVLICFALVNRPYVLDLDNDRSVVQRLLERQLNVYLIDWGEPSPEDCSTRLEDYICQQLDHVAQFVCEHSGAPQINLLGYCMGGAMSTLYAALYQQRVRNLVLLAAPIDCGEDDGLLNLWTKAEYFDVDGLIDAYGNCPDWFLKACFQLMKPVQNCLEKYLNLAEKKDDAAFLENFMTLQRWADDGIPVAGETFRDFVKFFYQQNLLIRGEMALCGRPVKLNAIHCPILMLVADQDHLVPPRSTLALKQYVESPEVEAMSINTGHIGLAVSSKAHSQLWPAAADWIASHSTSRN